MREEKSKSMKLLLKSLILCAMIILALPGAKTDAAKIRLSKTSISIYKGKTYKLTLKNVAKGKKVTWKSSKKSVATIKANGTSCTISAKKDGTAVVSAKVGKKTYKCKVKVKKLPTALSIKKKTIDAGSSFTLSLQNTSSTAKWSVSNKKVLSLKKLGKNKYKISGLKSGKANVYAKIGRKKYTCAVTVKVKPVPAKPAPTCVANQTVYEYGLTGFDIPSCFIFIKNLDKTATVTNIKSSNPYIMARKRGGMNAIEVMPASYDEVNLINMTSKISFAVIQNGKTYNLSCNIIVKEEESPFSSFKVGDQEFAAQYKGVMSVCAEVGGKKTVSIKMAQGYILDGIWILPNDINSRSVEVKNGSIVNFDQDIMLMINYHTTIVPANYTAPASWDAVSLSPLHTWKYFGV